MDRIDAFIGHSAKQKVLAGRFKVCLANYCGYDSFLAHEDIPGSALWEEEIIKGIESAVKTNSQIRDAYGLSKLKKILLETYNFSID